MAKHVMWVRGWPQRAFLYQGRVGIVVTWVPGWPQRAFNSMRGVSLILPCGSSGGALRVFVCRGRACSYSLARTLNLSSFYHGSRTRTFHGSRTRNFHAAGGTIQAQLSTPAKVMYGFVGGAAIGATTPVVK